MAVDALVYKNRTECLDPLLAALGEETFLNTDLRTLQSVGLSREPLDTEMTEYSLPSVSLTTLRSPLKLL